ncbi:prepilin-type N-terminal cleavage/methylation domain-containing protein [Patescibacteria group bacterium]|nr:prepilin-type N-terminal cleavage/methylation domain-containing protein [Patescibacteria group bacterium]MBU1915581.1 prepilin-type N-terminal cleavage/methylation domain-containing protein [Patescibacteria group bacterium]
MTQRNGFTFVELLIVIGIIGFLAAAILVAVDPIKRIQDSRNSQRWSDVNSVLNAVLKKQVDDRALYNGESSAPVITHAMYAQVIVADDTMIICNSAATRPGCNQTLDIAAANKNCVATLFDNDSVTTDDLDPTYMAELVTDPSSNSCGTGSGCLTEGDLGVGNSNSGYYIHRTVGNRIEIGACQPEQSATISVKR